MRITHHGDHLIQLAWMPLLFPVNCYLVKEEDGLTLVDTTMFSPAEDVESVSKELGMPLKRVALTHAHGDHVGGVDGIRERFPGVELSIGVRDAGLLEGNLQLAPDEPQVPIKGSLPKPTWKPDRLLEEGDRIGSLLVVASPGHTPGHIAFLDTRDRSLIAGDALQTRGGLAVSGVLQPLFPFVAMATWHKPTALRSAEALRKLEPCRLATGHGKVLENPAGPLDRAIETARRKFA